MAGYTKTKIQITKLDINKLVERSTLGEITQIRYPVVKPDEIKKVMRSLSMTKKQNMSSSKLGKSAEMSAVSSVNENAKIIRFLKKKEIGGKGFSFTETTGNIRIFTPRTSREQKIDPMMEYNIQQEKEIKEQKLVFSQKILQSMVRKKGTREKMPLNNVNLIDSLQQPFLSKDTPGHLTDRQGRKYQDDKYIAQTEGSPKMTKTDYMFRIKPSFIESVKEKGPNFDRSSSHPDMPFQNLNTEGKEPMISSRVQSKHAHRVSTEYAQRRKGLTDKSSELSATNARFEYYKKIQNISNPPYWEKWGKTLARFDEKDKKSREEKEMQKSKSREKLKPFISPFIRYREGMYRNGSPNEGKKDSQRENTQKSDLDDELEDDPAEPLAINKVENRNIHTVPDLPSNIKERLL